MRHVFTPLAYLAALTLTAIAMSFAILYLVGPHGGVLPAVFYLPMLCVGWAAIVVLPVLFARWMWRRLKVMS